MDLPLLARAYTPLIFPTRSGQNICPFSRARIRIPFPGKSIHAFTCSLFLIDFQEFSVWRLAFSSIHTGSIMTVKGWFRKPSHWKTVENQQESNIISPHAVNTWKSKPSHLKRLKIKKKEPLCERVNAFLKVKKTYSIYPFAMLLLLNGAKLSVRGRMVLPVRAFRQSATHCHCLTNHAQKQP